MPARALLRWTFTNQGGLEVFKSLWREGSQVIQNESVGARNTRLHTVQGEPLVLIAIAEWVSLEARERAFEILHTKYAPDHPVHSDGEGKFDLIGYLEEIDAVYPQRSCG